MIRDASQEIADHYLARVEEAAARAGLPRRRRDELLRDLRSELDEAGAASTADAMLDAIHDRGTPQAVVAAALADLPAPVYPAARHPDARRGRPELIAVVLVAVGWPFAGLGTLVAGFLLFTSGAWTRPEKFAGLGFAFFPYLTLSAGLSTGSHVSVLTNVAFAVGFLAPVAAGIVLWRRAGRTGAERELTAA